MQQKVDSWTVYSASEDRVLYVEMSWQLIMQQKIDPSSCSKDSRFCSRMQIYRLELKTIIP